MGGIPVACGRTQDCIVSAPAVAAAIDERWRTA
jgi:hypothetical protein